MDQKGIITEYLFKKLKFEPTEAQTPILECRKRFILVAGGEQAGKSMVASKYLVSRFLETEESGLYWLVAADYERTRAEFNYLVEDFAALGILASVTKRVDPRRYVRGVPGMVPPTVRNLEPRRVRRRTKLLPPLLLQ
jgi:hypothetical protein